MKKISIIISLLILTLSFTSCENYLDKKPLDKNSDETNWTSEASLETFAWSLYSNFSGYGSGWTRGQYLSSGLTDDYCSDGYSQPTQNAPSSSSTWNNGYTEIRKANTLLNRVDRIKGLDEKRANHWRGVARFFRGMKHYELVVNYGNIPWVDTEIDIDDAEGLSKSRDDRAIVMKNVCADLEFAANNCQYTTDNSVNNMVAAALLSRVALFEAAWQKYHNNNSAEAKSFYEIAKKAADMVISSGKYTIHTNYKSNYISKSLVGNTEMIMFKVYCHVTEGAKISSAHAMQGWSNSSSKSWGLTKSAVESFVNADGLPIHMSGYSDATLEDVFKNRDARLSIINNPDVLCPVGWAYTEGVNSSTGYWTDKLVDMTDYGKDTWNAPNNTADAPLYTYGEVLLNYAEACAEIEDLGGAAMSQSDLDKSVNELRAKHGNIPVLSYAGKGQVSVNGTAITADPKNDTGVSVLLWELRRERRSELMCDGFRYNDLKRWKLGRYIDLAKNPDCYLGASKAAIEKFVNDSQGEELYKDKKYSDVVDGNFWSADGKYISAYDMSKNIRVFDETKHYLEPIPTTQITLNPNLAPNNPGW